MQRERFHAKRGEVEGGLTFGVEEGWVCAGREEGSDGFCVAVLG